VTTRSGGPRACPWSLDQEDAAGCSPRRARTGCRALYREHDQREGSASTMHTRERPAQRVPVRWAVVLIDCTYRRPKDCITWARLSARGGQQKVVMVRHQHIGVHGAGRDGGSGRQPGQVHPISILVQEARLTSRPTLDDMLGHVDQRRARQSSQETIAYDASRCLVSEGSDPDFPSATKAA
jgi:hypothetical protein